MPIDSYMPPPPHYADKYPNGIFRHMNIIWLEDVSSYEYVRAYTEIAKTRNKKMDLSHYNKKNKHKNPILTPFNCRVVGYEILPPDADPISEGRFERRVFVVRDYDRCDDPCGTYKDSMPHESVLVENLLEGWCPVDPYEAYKDIEGDPKNSHRSGRLKIAALTKSI